MVSKFLHCALETCWQQFEVGQFLTDFLNDFIYEKTLIFSVKILISFMKNLIDFLYDFLYDFLNDHKISCYKNRVSTGGHRVETCWLGWQFLNGLPSSNCHLAVCLSCSVP